MSLANQLESYLMSSRGWSLRQPAKENVVLLLSGGLDSSLLAELCLNSLGATVYPLYVRRGAKAEAYEIAAAQRVVDYLKDIYGLPMKDLHVVTAPIPPLEIKDRFSKRHVIQHGYPLRNLALATCAVQYGVLLAQNGVSVRSVAIGSIGNDIALDATVEACMANTLSVCINLDDNQWQIVPPLLLPGLLEGRQSVSKMDLLDFADAMRFPVQLTRSCTADTLEACGRCAACKRRSALIATKEDQ